MTIEPNIFEFATSELSQDAFLCYLMSFGKSGYKDKNTEEYIFYKIINIYLGRRKTIIYVVATA